MRRLRPSGRLRRMGPWVGAAAIALMWVPGAAAGHEGTDPWRHRTPIPAFSRMYRTGCSTCHTAAPKLNVAGEAFRLAGYRLPSGPESAREDDPLPLGAPEWDRLWPTAIASSDLPGVPPVALHLIWDARVTRDPRVPYTATYLFPYEVHLLAATPLGDDVSIYLEAGWDRHRGSHVSQARVELHDVIPGLPRRSLNLRAGLQYLHLLTLADQHLDLAARQTPRWQTFEVSEVEMNGPGFALPTTSPNTLELAQPQAAVELGGLLGSRLRYGVGASQGLQDGLADANGRKDLYYKLRYKLGGMDLTGRYPEEGATVHVLPGQILDRSLTLEHFAYFGSESTPGAPQGPHRSFGFAARLLRDRWDVGVGWVRREWERPWQDLASGRLEAASVFGRVEYLVYPWLIASAKAERFATTPLELGAGVSAAAAPSDATTVLPGAVMLLNQNVRLIVEGELFLRSEQTDLAGSVRPHNLWVRLDVAF